MKLGKNLTAIFITILFSLLATMTASATQPEMVEG